MSLTPEIQLTESEKKTLSSLKVRNMLPECMGHISNCATCKQCGLKQPCKGVYQSNAGDFIPRGKGRGFSDGKSQNELNYKDWHKMLKDKVWLLQELGKNETEILIFMQESVSLTDEFVKQLTSDDESFSEDYLKLVANKQYIISQVS